MKTKLLFLFFAIPLILLGQSAGGDNAPDANVNIALLESATLSSNITNGRGNPRDILFDPATNKYAFITQFNEHGLLYNENKGLANKGEGFNWQVDWLTPKTINYITFGGTYPNQPQPNTAWAISYWNGAGWNILEQGLGGWIDRGVYEWGGPDANPITTTKLKVELYSNGINNLISVHIRARGDKSINRDDSTTNPKACLIQYLPPNNNQDNQSPSAPTLTENGKTQTTVNLSWSGAIDNIGITGYKVYTGNSLTTTLGNVSSYQVTGLSEDTSYQFTVKAFDDAGNESANSNTVIVTTNVADNSDGGSTGGGGTTTSVWTEANATASYPDNVAIGTTSVPSGYKMAIDGKLITEEVRVELSGSWPDYVFRDDYKLPSLDEIQKHIKEKGHLPKIPSAKEVKTNGIELGEMNKLVLEKIEELTLYILQLKKENKQQQLQIEKLIHKK